MTKEECIEILKGNVVQINDQLYTLDMDMVSQSSPEMQNVDPIHINDTLSSDSIVVADVISSKWKKFNLEEIHVFKVV